MLKAVEIRFTRVMAADRMNGISRSLSTVERESSLGSYITDVSSLLMIRIHRRQPTHYSASSVIMTVRRRWCRP